ncbi:MAG: hypothetical protein ABI761_10230 [Saprospiraceae bacterium]
MVIKGIAYFAMGDTVISSAFPTLAAGKSAAIPLLQFIAALSIGFALVTYAATRNYAQLLGKYTVGSGIFIILTLKHK